MSNATMPVNVSPRHGVRYPPEPFEGYTRVWYVGPATLTDDEARSEFETACDANADGFYGGPGRAFAHRASVRRSRNRVLVVQTGGLDI